jgi:hypothetical protein
VTSRPWRVRTSGMLSRSPGSSSTNRIPGGIPVSPRLTSQKGHYKNEAFGAIIPAPTSYSMRHAFFRVCDNNSVIAVAGFDPRAEGTPNPP